ncbi:MAG: hypothetical protein RPT25_06915 [Cycloclasticus sp.]|jgi:hypothetical protein
MISKNLLCALGALILLVGCGKNYHESFTLEQDGEIKFLTYPEFQGIQTSPLIDLESLSIDLQYAELFESGSETGVDKENLEAHRQLVVDNEGIVDNSIYQYIVAIPVKSNKNIYNLPYSHGSKLIRVYFVSERCQESYPYGRFGVTFIPGADVIQSDDGFFHYNLYIQSNLMAGQYLLNNIGDICINYRDIDGGTFADDSYDIQSNTMTIKAQDIMDVLGSLGIMHE